MIYLHQHRFSFAYWHSSHHYFQQSDPRLSLFTRFDREDGSVSCHITAFSFALFTELFSDNRLSQIIFLVGQIRKNPWSYSWTVLTKKHAYWSQSNVPNWPKKTSEVGAPFRSYSVDLKTDLLLTFFF